MVAEAKERIATGVNLLSTRYTLLTHARKDCAAALLPHCRWRCSAAALPRCRWLGCSVGGVVGDGDGGDGCGAVAAWAASEDTAIAARRRRRRRFDRSAACRRRPVAMFLHARTQTIQHVRAVSAGFEPSRAPCSRRKSPHVNSCRPSHRKHVGPAGGEWVSQAPASAARSLQHASKSSTHMPIEKRGRMRTRRRARARNPAMRDAIATRHHACERRRQLARYSHSIARGAARTHTQERRWPAAARDSRVAKRDEHDEAATRDGRRLPDAPEASPVLATAPR